MRRTRTRASENRGNNCAKIRSECNFVCQRGFYSFIFLRKKALETVHKILGAVPHAIHIISWTNEDNIKEISWMDSESG